MGAAPRCVAFGEFELDEARCELRRSGEPVELLPTPYRLLQYLIQERDRVVSRDEVLEAVWPEAVVSDTALSSAVKAVRQALGDDGRTQRWVKTFGCMGRHTHARVTGPSIPRDPRSPN